MTRHNDDFDPRELCSRKLWQLVATEEGAAVDKAALQQAVKELAQRRHYLEELQRLGKLEHSRQFQPAASHGQISSPHRQ